MTDTLATADGVALPLPRWAPKRPARGAVQLVHGLGEHCGRYGKLAAALVAALVQHGRCDRRSLGCRGAAAGA